MKNNKIIKNYIYAYTHAHMYTGNTSKMLCNIVFSQFWLALEEEKICCKRKRKMNERKRVRHTEKKKERKEIINRLEKGESRNTTLELQ